MEEKRPALFFHLWHARFHKEGCMKRIIIAGAVVVVAVCAVLLAAPRLFGSQNQAAVDVDDATPQQESDGSSASVPEGVAASETAQSDEGASYSTREIWVENDGQRIYGVAYIPDGVSQAPLVILSHGLGATHTMMVPYAQELAEHGYAAYAFDFRGGATSGSQSDGDTTSMSVMTEASDLEAVAAAAQSWDFVDTSRIVLAGGSQGGMVSAVIAARNPSLARALILLYPALSIVDDVHAAFATEDDIPETYSLFGWMTVGRNYATDVWDYDVYGEIGKYTGPVLIVHGDRDNIVDVSYSQRAAEVYQDCELDIIPGAGHGFTGDAYDQSVQYALDFLATHA